MIGKMGLAFMIFIIGAGLLATAFVYAFTDQYITLDLNEFKTENTIEGDTMDTLDWMFNFIPVAIILAAGIGFVGVSMTK